MLSSQTKDQVTAAAITRLKQELPDGLTLSSLLAVTPREIDEMICKVGFHNRKSMYIKQTAEILRDRYSSDIPDTVEGLLGLPGVGPKMAYLCLSAAWNKVEGIGVDVHVMTAIGKDVAKAVKVHRITNLLGWNKTATPEATRHMLEQWLPKDKWKSINPLLVGFGQMICRPSGRKCQDCALSTLRLCPGTTVRSDRPVAL